MTSFLYFAEITKFIVYNLEILDLACPSPDHNQLVTKQNIIMLDLISIKRMKFITIHSPNINSSICLTSRRYDIFLIFRNKNTLGVTLKNISIKFLNQSKILSFLTNKLIISNSLIKI